MITIRFTDDILKYLYNISTFLLVKMNPDLQIILRLNNDCANFNNIYFQESR